MRPRIEFLFAENRCIYFLSSSLYPFFCSNKICNSYVCNLHYEKFADGTEECIEDEIPFDIPDSWVWVRLGALAQYKKGPFGSSITKSMFVPDSPSAIKVYEQKNAINKDASLGNYFISEEKYESLKGFEIFPNDIIVSCAGTIGETYVMPKNMRKGIINQALMKITLHDLRIIDFYLIYFDCQLKTAAREQGHGVALKNIPPFDVLKKYLVPIPPIQEQTRIVDTVNDLLGTVSSIDTFKDELFDSITSVKSKILDLAIRGKLVPQNPDDEPATVLLERIRAEKEELIKQGKIKRDNKESVIVKGEDNSYYVRSGEQVEDIAAWELDDLPESWGICALGEICDYGSCTNVETDQISDDEWILDLEDIEKDSGKVLRKVRKLERNAVSTKHKFSEGQVLYSKLRPYLNKVVLADEDGYCTSEILPLDFSDIIVPAYARYYLMSPTFLKYADRCSYGVKMPRLSTTDGKKAVFTLPPINEQDRVVEAIENAFAQLDAIADSLN